MFCCSNEQYDLKNFEKRDKIQSLKSCHYYEMINLKNGTKYFLKSSRKSFDEYTSKKKFNLYNEIKIFSKINHPSFLKFVGFISEPKPSLLLEYISENTLNSYIRMSNEHQIPKLTDTQKLIILFSIASGLSYLHSHNIIHCNLSTSTVFLSNELYPKITGFDYSKELSQNCSHVTFSKQKGIDKFLAPEILTDLEYSKYSDVYAFGTLIYELMNQEKNSMKKEEDEEEEEEEFNEKSTSIVQPKINFQIENCYRTLIERCWSQNPKERPTFDDILNELKTNNEFITEKVDFNEFTKFVKTIEESQSSIEEGISIDKIIEFFPLDSEQIEPTEIDVKPLNLNLLVDIKNYNCDDRDYMSYKLKLIYLCHITEKDTGLKLHANEYQIEINNFLREEMISFRNNVNTASQFNHPAILKILGYSPVDFNNKPHPVIITEPYNDYDESHDNYQGRLSIYNDTNVLIIIYGIASAMSYLHKNNIIHRNLKPANVVLNDNSLPKIIGFDLSREIGQNDGQFKDCRIQGTPAYLAPEVYDKQVYSKSSDVYSFALIVYQMVTHNLPFENLNNPEEIREKVLYKQERPKFNKPIQKCYRQLIEKCWSQDSKSRPTFDEIVNELKTNQEFIFDSINKEQYEKYIKFIDEYPISFNPTRRVRELDEIVNTRINTFQHIEYNQGLRNIYDTEINNLSFNYEFMRTENENENFIFKKFFNLAKHDIVNLSRQFNNLFQVNHPSILKLNMYIIREYNFFEYQFELEQTEKLSNFLIQKNDLNSKLNNTNKLIIMYGIASAMSYLHKNKIIHRDLKSSNIVLDENKYPKLAGFDLSREIVTSSIMKEFDCRVQGTPAYLAPEIYEKQEYNKASDVYSFAFLVYELITENFPFDDYLSPREIREKVLYKQERPKFNKPIQKCYRQLIEKCWSQDSKFRPTFDEIVNELKTNQEFIFDSINKEQYEKYIKFIDEYPITFNYTKKKLHLDEYTKTKLWMFDEFKSKINFKDIYQTEFNEILFEFDFININKYEKQKLIFNNDFRKIYIFKNKENEKQYITTKFKQDIESNLSTFGKHFHYEITNLIQVKHPSFLRYLGFSPKYFKNKNLPVFLYEFASNGSLEKILELETDHSILNDTKKLIILYGISSGMSYLHSIDIIHCQLNPSTIFIDEFLYPKIFDFSCSLKSSEWPIPDMKEEKIEWFINSDLDVYIAPDSKWSSAADVYSFALIAYYLITGEKPFGEFSIYEVPNLVLKQKYRPKFNESMPDCYKKLIERCWAQNPKERPTFNEIVFHLRSNKEFINDSIDKDEFNNYVNFLDEVKNKLKTDETFVPFENYIESNNSTFRKVNIDFESLKKSKMIFSVNIGSVDLDSYNKSNKIGAGCFGSVYKVINRNTEDVCAAKISIYEMDLCSENTIVNLSREIDIISKLKHPSILQFIGYSPMDFKLRSKPVIITEYAVNGSLDVILEKSRKGLCNDEWNDTKKLINIYGLASAMQYLHEREIIHRDLKPANILLDEFLYPKLADFGLSKELPMNRIKIESKNEPLISGFKGTYAYCAPEILDSNTYSKEGDVYAFGMIVYEIMTNEIIFNGFNIYKMILAISNGYRPKFNVPIPYCYKKLIEKCWSNNCIERPSFWAIVNLIEKDRSFITSNVDENEFFDYIETIKEFNNDKKIELVPSSNENKSINQNSKSINVNRIIETENDQIEMRNDTFLNLEKFDRVKLIQKGSLSKLYKLKDKDTGEFYLAESMMMKIKKIEKDELDSFSKEITILKNLKHPNLLKFIGFSPLDFKKENKPVIVMEYASKITLKEIIEIEQKQGEFEGWNLTKKFIVLFGIASGMSYLHSKGILHRSLSPSNILLDDILTPKIGDYGLSTRFFLEDKMTHQSISGMKATPIYTAPEVLLCDDDFSMASDIYSFAIIFYEIISSRKPFAEIENMNQLFNEIVKNGKRPIFDERFPAVYRELIDRCWSQDPKERPMFDEILIEMKTNKAFLIEKINKNDFYKYVNFVEEQIETETFLMKIEETQENSNIINRRRVAHKKKEFNDNDEIITESLKNNINSESLNEVNDNDEIITESLKNIINNESLNEVNNNDEIITESLKNSINNESLNEVKNNDEIITESLKNNINNESLNEINDNDEIITESLKNNINNESLNEVIQNESSSSENLKRNQNELNMKSKTIKHAKNFDVESLELNFIKFCNENDTENIYKFALMLIKKGQTLAPLEYAAKLYNLGYYKQSFGFFNLISRTNNPISYYYIGIMKFYGQGCSIDREESKKILSRLSKNGIDKATEFLENHSSQFK